MEVKLLPDANTRQLLEQAKKYMASRERRRKWLDERYRLLIESGGVVTFDYDPEADTFTYSLCRGEDGLRSVTVSRCLADFPQDMPIHSGSAALFRDALSTARNSRTGEPFDYRADFFGTGFRWWRTRTVGVPDETGRIVRVVGRADDIQAEKDNEQRLRTAAERESSFRRIITSGALAALEFDLDTGERIPVKGDILPRALHENVTLEDALAYLSGIVHHDDRQIFQGHFDPERIRHDLTARNRKISFDCRAGDRWLGITYMHSAAPDTGHDHLLLYIVDIHEKKTAQLALMDRARRDPLTGLYNRNAFREHFASLTEKGGEGLAAAFVMIDLDSFKQYNDSHGHVSGDRLLRAVSSTLRAFLQDGDVAARLGGDEFALCLRRPQDAPLFRERMRILCGALRQTAEGGSELTASMGVSLFPEDAADFDTLYDRADRALYRAKWEGGCRFAFYSPEQDRAAVTTSGCTRRVFVRTFGYFDVFVDGRAIPFPLAKARELLALLIDRRGGFLSAGEAISFLWEDEAADEVTLSRYRKVAMRLKNILSEYGISDILECRKGLRRIVPDKLSCDYYSYLSGRADCRSLFKGSYLSNYSWGENTLSTLLDSWHSV